MATDPLAPREKFDAFVLQETHTAESEIAGAEDELAKAGYKGVFTAARRSDRSDIGTFGGTAVVMKGHHQATSFRHLLGPSATANATTDIRHGKQQTGNNFAACDWTATAWHLKGVTLTLISIYLDGGQPLETGINAKKLGQVTSFVNSIQGPWMLCGDFNVPAEKLWASRWPQAMQAVDTITLPNGSYT